MMTWSGDETIEKSEVAAEPNGPTVREVFVPSWRDLKVDGILWALIGFNGTMLALGWGTPEVAAWSMLGIVVMLLWLKALTERMHREREALLDDYVALVKRQHELLQASATVAVVPMPKGTDERLN